MKSPLKSQSGAETLEFLVVFLMFMIFIMTVFDFARALYVWNALAEATRRGARMAAVCPIDSASQEIVKNVATFDTLNGSLGTSPVVKGLTSSAFDIVYYDGDFNPTTDIKVINFVEVSLNNNYQFQFIIPFMQGPVDQMPTFKTTLYAESLGAIPFYPGDTPPNPSLSCNF